MLIRENSNLTTVELSLDWVWILIRDNSNLITAEQSVLGLGEDFIRDNSNLITVEQSLDNV